LSNKLKIYRHIFALLLFSATPISSFAEPLTEQSISQFAQTWASLTKRLVSVDAEFDPQNSAGVTMQLAQMAQTDGPKSALDEAVSTDGYRDFETWAAAASQIIKTARWAKNPVDAADLEQAIKSIENDQNQTAEDKALLIADIKSAYETAQMQKPKQADIDQVKRMLPLLEAIISPAQ
jgi:hypothetical protein